MKTHSQDFKNNICLLGKQQEVKITYIENDEEKILDGENINNATPHYEGSLLKSVMKELDLDSNVDIPKDTEINFQYGLLVGEQYEYLDFGNYIVYSSEKQEDKYSYKIKCYDKLLYSMRPYENMNITYPITVRNYINSLCNYLGLTFANASSTFTNYDKEILAELYLDTDGKDIGYNFRDVFDELAQVTGSVICINNNDEVEIRYPKETNDTIDEEYLKDVNVNFGEKYGPINTVILSRSEGSDKITQSIPANLPDNEKIAIEIADNQILNFNNRVEYLGELLNRLYGTEYYINDFTSTGIVYYDLLDKYNVQIGENTYNCLMLNDEINITQGIEETIHTEILEESQTDYSKTDKTDRKINQTYLIVDKQNQRIDSVITNVTEQNNKISQITQTVGELNSKISDIADITTAGESMIAVVQLDDINKSEPIEIRVRPITENISYLYPRNNLYPSNNLFMKERKIRFINTEVYVETLDKTYNNYKSYFAYEDNEYVLLVEGTDYNNGDTIEDTIYEYQYVDYEIPDDLLYYDSNTYDEFYLNYNSETCQIIKKCKYNADGTVGLLSIAETTNYEYPHILLDDGNYTIQLLGYDTGYLSVRLMAQNIYTTQFATKAELSSSITQTANEINLRVDEKLDEEDFTSANIMLKINNDESQATINADKINLNGAVTANNNFKILTDGSMESVNGKFTGGNINMLDTSSQGVGNNIYMENINDTNKNASIGSTGYNFKSNNLRSYLYNGPSLINQYMGNSNSNTAIASQVGTDSSTTSFYVRSGNNYSWVHPSYMQSKAFNTTSLETEKKNFQKLENALKIIKDIDIYKYNYKTQEDNEKKHIGFVIGNNYNYSKAVTSENNDSADIYSFVSVCCKAIQEQQEIIENLQKQINELKGEKENE